jgi:hypothetical protein
MAMARKKTEKPSADSRAESAPGHHLAEAVGARRMLAGRHLRGFSHRLESAHRDEPRVRTPNLVEETDDTEAVILVEGQPRVLEYVDHVESAPVDRLLPNGRVGVHVEAHVPEPARQLADVRVRYLEVVCEERRR